MSYDLTTAATTESIKAASVHMLPCQKKFQQDKNITTVKSQVKDAEVFVLCYLFGMSEPRILRFKHTQRCEKTANKGGV